MSRAKEGLPRLIANLRTKYGVNTDLTLIDSLIKARIAEKIMEDIHQVISSWHIDELAQAEDMLAEYMASEARR